MDTIHFIGFFLRILRDFLHLKIPPNFRILLLLKQLSYKTTLHKRNSPFSRNLVMSERERRGQRGVMWTEYRKRSNANHIAWINLIQSNTTHCAKLELMRAQESHIDTSTAQVIPLMWYNWCNTSVVIPLMWYLSCDTTDVIQLM